MKLVKAKPVKAKAPGLVAIVAYDDLRTFEYAIAAEIFALVRPTLGVKWYDTIVVSPDRGRLKGIGGVEIAVNAPFERIAEAQTVVLPGWRDVSNPPPKKLLDAIRAAADRGARLVSICSGAFV
ncbi:MAG: DJ-1/PfpI family protein, partial [Betaproteobacteria bacterium]|nr:DJ-1/PfpI family protein [Betaproteobacteria bacterium]